MTFLLYRPENILNVSQIPLKVNDDVWSTVLSPADNIYTDKLIVKKKNSKKEVSFTLNLLICLINNYMHYTLYLLINS